MKNFRRANIGDNKAKTLDGYVLFYVVTVCFVINADYESKDIYNTKLIYIKNLARHDCFASFNCSTLHTYFLQYSSII